MTTAIAFPALRKLDQSPHDAMNNLPLGHKFSLVEFYCEQACCAIVEACEWPEQGEALTFILGSHSHANKNKIANHSIQNVQNLGNKRR